MDHAMHRSVFHRFVLAGTAAALALGGFAPAAMAQRDPAYDAARAGGQVGEKMDGYLGVVGAGTAAVVAILVGLAIRRRLRTGDTDRVTYWVRRGAVAGLVGIAAQSLVELSLQMPGNAGLCVVLAALAVHRPRSGPHAHRV